MNYYHLLVSFRTYEPAAFTGGALGISECGNVGDDNPYYGGRMLGGAIDKPIRWMARIETGDECAEKERGLIKYLY